METAHTAATGTSAPYGHACANCSKAKTRCISRAGERCERCHRLDKDCTPSTAVRKRQGSKPSTPSTKRARLEERLDDLVTLLQSQNAQKRPEVVPDSAEACPDTPAHPWIPKVWKSNAVRQAATSGLQPSGDVSAKESLTTINPFLEQMARTPSATTSSTPDTSAASLPQYDLPPAEEEQLLQRFRRFHMKSLPFLYIPGTTTAQHLQQTRPFFWLVIRAVCTKSMTEQHALGAHIREILAKQIYVEFERSVDLLLGLLTYLAASPCFAQGRPYMCAMSSLASTIVFDLRLDRKARNDLTNLPGMNCFKLYAFPKPPVALAPTSKTRTNEERRALLGCFFTTSITSCYMRFEAARWRPNLEDSLTHLWETPEAPYDRVLVALIRMMIIVDDATRLTSRMDDLDPTPPSMFCIKALLGSLQEVKSTFTADILENPFVKAQMCSTEVLIYELAMYQPPSSPPYKSHEYKRREYLQAAVESAKTFLETFISIDATGYLGLPFWLLIEYAHSSQVLYRLSLLDDPGWDRSMVRQTADIIYYLEQTAVKMDQAHEMGNFGVNGSDGSLFTKAAFALRMTIPSWTANLEAIGAVTAAQTEAQTISSTIGVQSTNVQTDPMLMDFADDTWLTDMFASWEGS
ncbi:hypothetical protein TruAng_009681 [Truncatella angustata]|nr:hypothetical protein TruAng_009681 [Truncatella angustata]